MPEEFDMLVAAKNAVDTTLRSRGVTNILLAGKTGVGKSSLLNAVFQGRFAQTGQGKPITTHTKKITKKGVPVGIYDTKGIEVKDHQEILQELTNLVDIQNGNEDPKEHIHVCWLCIAESGRRVEDAEIELAKEISKKMPVIVVITKAQADRGFKAECEQLIPEARNYVRVNSVEEQLDGGNTIQVFGLDDLVNLTMEVIPEGQKMAFAAAQRVKLELKVSSAHKVVIGAAASAATVGAVPVPFSDAVGIIPIQIGMLAGISVSFGLDIDKAFLGTLVSGTFAAVAGGLGGRALVGALLKMVPGVGAVPGAIIAAGVASAVTTTFGEAYIATLKKIFEQDPDSEPSPEEIAEAFKNRLTKSK